MLPTEGKHEQNSGGLTWHDRFTDRQGGFRFGFQLCLKPCYVTRSMPVSSFIKHNTPYLMGAVRRIK